MSETIGIFDENEAQRIANKNLADDALARSTETPLDTQVKSTEANSDIQKANIPLVDTTRRESLQPRAEADMAQASGADILNNLQFFFQSGDILPVWWSPSRDIALSEFWKAVNVLSGAMYAMASKMATIPFHIEPEDMAITSHFREATRFERRLKESAEYGAGWGQFFQMQMQSLLGQDNGRFMEIIDLSSNKLGPRMGEAISVAHLDPTRCTRTSVPEFPVRYLGIDGKARKIHWTRVAFESQMPSERVLMHKIGVCAVSRASSYGQNMLDMSQYKEEKLGSRPTRGLMVVGSGLDAEAVGKALGVAAGMSDSRGLKRFSLLPIIGNPDIENPAQAISLLSLSSLPDGFDEEKSTTIAMAAIALAFGVDARELWPGLQSGATRADAILSHIKQRGKGPGHIIAETERMFNNWFLPRHLKMVFDFQDDAQDRQRAEISRERSLKRKSDIEVGVTDTRTERELMVKEGALSTAQFSNLELEDGRLPDGRSLDTLFFRPEPIYQEILALSGISDPTDIRGNDAEKVLDAISVQRTVALDIISKETRQIQMRQAREALAALDALAQEYQFGGEAEKPPTVDGTDPEARQRLDARGPQASQEDEHPITTPITQEGDMSSENAPRELKVITKEDQMEVKQMFLEGLKSLFQPESTKTIVEVYPEINVDVPETIVNVDIPETIVNVNVPETVVNVPKQDAPTIEVKPTIKVPKADVNVTVKVPEQPAPTVEKDTKLEIIDIERNEAGEITTLKRRKKK